MDIFDIMRQEGIGVLRVGKNVRSWFPLYSTGATLRLLERTGEYDHEEVALFFDEKTGLKAIIAIHDSTLGPALGGTRIIDYLTPEEKRQRISVPEEEIVKRAIFDVLRLSRGMTYKSSVAGLNLGGAKGIIIADPDKEKRPVLLYQYGKCVDTFGGKFITGEDMNVKIPDADIISFATLYVAGLSPDNPRRRGSGDPSPWTARGVFQSMRAVLEEIYGTDSFKGITVAIQGIAGNVGSNLAEFLSNAGAKLIGCGGRHVEKTKEICKKYGAEMLEDRDKIYDVECDIFSPNAGGAIINDETLPRLKCKAVVGGANNQPLRPEHGDRLHELGILYIPDYVANAGGVINVCVELMEGGYSPELAAKLVDNIYCNIRKIVQISRDENLPTHVVADRLAKERVREKIINEDIPPLVAKL